MTGGFGDDENLHGDDTGNGNASDDSSGTAPPADAPPGFDDITNAYMGAGPFLGADGMDIGASDGSADSDTSPDQSDDNETEHEAVSGSTDLGSDLGGESTGSDDYPDDSISPDTPFDPGESYPDDEQRSDEDRLTDDQLQDYIDGYAMPPPESGYYDDERPPDEQLPEKND